MALEVNEDARDPLLSLADQNAPGEMARSFAEAGFEAGLSVIIEALPTASIVIDETCRVLAANTAARPAADGLMSSEPLACLRKAVSQASSATEPGRITLNLGTRREEYLVMLLPGPSVRAKELFLLSAAQEETGRSRAPYTPLQDYDLAPGPVRALREQALEFKRLSETDPLTGALNVRAFAASVRQALARTPRPKGAMIFVDLNGFKSINDRFGHTAGDKVLMHVASKLTFPPQTWIVTARMGGDEFALWVPFVEQISLPKIIEGIRARLRVPVDLSDLGTGDTWVTPTAAVGAVHCPEEALNYETMRRLADRRMYRDKANAERPSFGHVERL